MPSATLLHGSNGQAQVSDCSEICGDFRVGGVVPAWARTHPRLDDLLHLRAWKGIGYEERRTVSCPPHDGAEDGTVQNQSRFIVLLVHTVWSLGILGSLISPCYHKVGGGGAATSLSPVHCSSSCPSLPSDVFPRSTVHLRLVRNRKENQPRENACSVQFVPERRVQAAEISRGSTLY